MSVRINSFGSELELSNFYSEIIQDAIIDFHLNVDFKLEVSAPGCRPDMILFDRKASNIHYLISFEFKLRNWRRAVYQAFRYRNFGNESYVILDYERSESAAENLEVFQKANVGLITIESNGKLTSWYVPKPQLPFSKEFSYSVACSLLVPEKPTINDLLFTTDIKGDTEIEKIKHIWL